LDLAEISSGCITRALKRAKNVLRGKASGQQRKTLGTCPNQKGKKEEAAFDATSELRCHFINEWKSCGKLKRKKEKKLSVNLWGEGKIWYFTYRMDGIKGLGRKVQYIRSRSDGRKEPWKTSSENTCANGYGEDEEMCHLNVA